MEPDRRREGRAWGRDRPNRYLGFVLKVSKEKQPALRKMLASDKLDPELAKVTYTKIPVTTKLDIAEKVYTVLGRDDEFWCRFHRLRGYHLEREKDKVGAAAARKKALVLAEKLASDKARIGQLKELLLISGAMRHLLGDDKTALAYFRQAIMLSTAPHK